MLRRVSRTFYLADNPRAVIGKLEARGWRRVEPGRATELARLTQGAAVVIVYRNHEVAAQGQAAIEELHRLWAAGA